jgi:Flp pilus assembly protein TadD
MIRDSKFWIPMTIFQVLFGLTVFGLTRDYYLYGSDRSGLAPATSARTDVAPTADLQRPAPTPTPSSQWNGSESDDPVEVSRQAGEAFANKEYGPAADRYARLLELVPEDVETHNNLGLTLHYLGRSTEALRALNDGIAIDPEHQRTWLTLGYVNQQLGKDEPARKALMNASLIGDDEAIRKSAMEMLRELP